jgi:hypothetical protein
MRMRTIVFAEMPRRLRCRKDAPWAWSCFTTSVRPKHGGVHDGGHAAAVVGIDIRTIGQEQGDDVRSPLKAAPPRGVCPRSLRRSTSGAVSEQHERGFRVAVVGREHEQ